MVAVLAICDRLDGVSKTTVIGMTAKTAIGSQLGAIPSGPGSASVPLLKSPGYGHGHIRSKDSQIGISDESALVRLSGSMELSSKLQRAKAIQTLLRTAFHVKVEKSAAGMAPTAIASR